MSECETFSVACPRCGATYDVPLELLGKKALCPSCSAKFAMEPPPGPEGRELLLRARQAKQEDDTSAVSITPEDGEVVNDLGSMKAIMEQKKLEQQAMSTNTVKLSRFRKNRLQEKAESSASHVSVNQDALQAALKSQRGRSTQTITSDMPESEKSGDDKKWWQFWK